MKLFPKAVIFALLAIALSACATQNKEMRRMTLRQSIGNAYGVDYFGSIEQIQYEFNVKIGDKWIKRFWIWEPKIDRVTFKGMNYQKDRSGRSVHLKVCRRSVEIGRDCRLF